MRVSRWQSLKQRGVAAWSALDAGNVGLSDQAQLEYARHKKAVIFTHDADFLRPAHEWAQAGKEHWGIIYVHEKKLSIGECIRRLIRYAPTLEPEDMKNHIEFCNLWALDDAVFDVPELTAGEREAVYVAVV